jgi:A/G-specific adenine glycosylase
MSWYLKTKRALPWRSEPTPYRVWISEVMLQQTQAATVSPYYVRFLGRFPNLETLAKASEQEVLALWSGLGYYSRARNLHKAARKIFQFNGGVFPSDFEAIFDLPGVGRYTAGAICSLAFNQPQPIVDGNIRRVITRFNGIIAHTPESYFWKQMKEWIPEGKASIFNQAMMELGALVCLPSQPHCVECPVRNDCRALEMNLQNSLPHPRPRRPARYMEMVILVLHNRNKLLLVNKMPDFIPGQWGFPSRVIPNRSSAEKNACGLSLRIYCKSFPLSKCAKLSHAIGNRRIVAHVFAGEASGKIRLAMEELCWIKRSKAGIMLTSSLFLKALSKIDPLNL